MSRDDGRVIIVIIVSVLVGTHLGAFIGMTYGISKVRQEAANAGCAYYEHSPTNTDSRFRWVDIHSLTNPATRPKQ